MKYLIIVAVAGLMASPVVAEPSTPPTTFGLQPTDPQFHGGYPPSRRIYEHSPKVQALLDLREEGLRLREADGGTLTEEHRAYLQKKLDAIQAEYPSDPAADTN